LGPNPPICLPNFLSWRSVSWNLLPLLRPTLEKVTQGRATLT
jgi:hypothetical protein